MRCHGFDAIGDEVRDHLLELDPVARHARQPRSQLGSDRDIVILQRAAHQRQGFADGVVEVDLDVLRLVLGEKRTDPLDHVPGAVGLPDDAREAVADFLEIRPVRQPAQRCLAIGDDGGERLVDLMGDDAANAAKVVSLVTRASSAWAFCRASSASARSVTSITVPTYSGSRASAALGRPRLSSRLTEPSGRTMRKPKPKSALFATAFARVQSKAGRSSGWIRPIASS
jgi:hypothetical protein